MGGCCSSEDPREVPLQPRRPPPPTRYEHLYGLNFPEHGIAPARIKDALKHTAHELKRQEQSLIIVASGGIIDAFRLNSAHDVHDIQFFGSETTPDQISKLNEALIYAERMASVDLSPACFPQKAMTAMGYDMREELTKAATKINVVLFDEPGLKILSVPASYCLVGKTARLGTADERQYDLYEAAKYLRAMRDGSFIPDQPSLPPDLALPAQQLKKYCNKWFKSLMSHEQMTRLNNCYQAKYGYEGIRCRLHVFLHSVALRLTHQVTAWRRKLRNLPRAKELRLCTRQLLFWSSSSESHSHEVPPQGQRPAASLDHLSGLSFNGKGLPGKGVYDTLKHTAADLQRQSVDITIVTIGDITEALSTESERAVHNIHFFSARLSKESAQQLQHALKFAASKTAIDLTSAWCHRDLLSISTKTQRIWTEEAFKGNAAVFRKPGLKILAMPLHHLIATKVSYLRKPRERPHDLNDAVFYLKQALDGGKLSDPRTGHPLRPDQQISTQFLRHCTMKYHKPTMTEDQCGRFNGRYQAKFGRGVLVR